MSSYSLIPPPANGGMQEYVIASALTTKSEVGLGHARMECDSMHAAIEHTKKGTSIFIPSMWKTAIHIAKELCQNVKVTITSKGSTR